MEQATPASHQPLNIPQRKGSHTQLCDLSSLHEQTILSTESPIGLDLDDNSTCSSHEGSPDTDRGEHAQHWVFRQQHSNLKETPQQSQQESILESDDDFAETDAGDGGSYGSQEEDESRLPTKSLNESTSSFDALLQDFDLGTCIVDLKRQRDHLNSPLKDGSNATGDDPPTYPTHLTTRYGDEEDITYRGDEGDEEEVPLRTSPPRDRQQHHHPGFVTTRPSSISNSINSNISSPQPYYAKQAKSPGGSAGFGATSSRGEDVGSFHDDSQPTAFLLNEERVRAFMVDYYDDINSIGQSKECLETFFAHYCIPDVRWMRPSGNPISLEGLVKLFTEDMKIKKMWLVSIDSVQILAGGLAAVVTITVDQLFEYRGIPNGDRAVISSVLEVVNHGREIKIVHEHRTSGRPIPKESRWSTTES